MGFHWPENFNTVPLLEKVRRRDNEEQKRKEGLYVVVYVVVSFLARVVRRRYHATLETQGICFTNRPFALRSLLFAHHSSLVARRSFLTFHCAANCAKVEGRTATFKDGSTKEIDAVILCTGYKHHFPFMPDALRLKTANRLCSDSLYRGVVWEANPKLFYLGMQDQWYTFNMFDAQAWYARDVILGRQEIPSVEEQKADFDAWRAREGTLNTDEEMIEYQVNTIQYKVMRLRGQGGRVCVCGYGYGMQLGRRLK